MIPSWGIPSWGGEIAHHHAHRVVAVGYHLAATDIAEHTVARVRAIGHHYMCVFVSEEMGIAFDGWAYIIRHVERSHACYDVVGR